MKTGPRFGIFPFLRWWLRVDRSGTRADLMAGLTGAISACRRV